MAKINRHIPMSLTAAALVHVVAVLLLIIGFQMTRPPKGIAKPQIETVKANVIDAGELERREREKKRVEERERQRVLEEKRRKEEEQRAAEESKRQAELKQEQERKRREQAQRRAEEAKRQAALKRQQEEERKRQEEERRRAEEAKRQERKRQEAERKAEEERLAAIMAEEEAALKAAEERRKQQAYKRELQALTERYVAAIADKIERLWRKPADARVGEYCFVHVQQTPGGFVEDVQVRDCTGDEKFRRSVEAAVWKADPLPPPPKPEVFDRELRFKFIPQS